MQMCNKFTLLNGIISKTITTLICTPVHNKPRHSSTISILLLRLVVPLSSPAIGDGEGAKCYSTPKVIPTMLDYRTAAQQPNNALRVAPTSTGF